MKHIIEQAISGEPIKTEGFKLAKMSRRGFLGATGAAFAIGAFAGKAEAFIKYDHGGNYMPNGVKADPHIFISIDKDGTVNLMAIRAEMGTGSRTSLPMVIADELEADWDRVVLHQAEGDEIKYGNQDTDGSRSLRHHVQSHRQMGAAVRHMLAAAAAEAWGVPASEVKVENHTISHPSGKSADFGEMAEAAFKQAVPAHEDITYKTEDQFRYIGKGAVQIADLRDITTGAAVYGADVNLPGMVYAVVARPPVVGAKPTKVNASATLAIDGVHRTATIPGSIMPAKFAPLGGIAVIADNTWTALQGRDALEIEWSDSPHSGYNSEAYMAQMVETSKKPGQVSRAVGDVDAAMGSAAKTFSRTYTQAHMAHAPMEPPAAIADVKASSATIWGPFQSPFGARGDIAAALGMPIENVTVHTTLLGGGFGRKSKCDYGIEAALLSQKIRKPVKVQWTREDDIQHSFYHTTSADTITVGLDDAGKVTAWDHNATQPTILSTFAPDGGHAFFLEQAMGHQDVPFDIPNIRAHVGQAMSHTRIGWFRAVSNIPRAWAIQSFVAELADELGKDQLEMLKELIGAPRTIDLKGENFPENFWNYGEPSNEFPIETGRLANVAQMAADGIGWGKSMPSGEGLGVAVHRSFVSYVAAAAHVKVVDGEIRVPEMHIAIDAGFIANPERVESQLQGAAVMGMTALLHSGVHFEDGAAVESNFNDYEMVRSTNYPENVKIHVVDHPFSVHATGVGEPGVPPVIPAIANAIANATGERHRDMPINANA